MTAEYRFIKLLKNDLVELLNNPARLLEFTDTFCLDQTWDVIDHLLINHTNGEKSVLQEAIKEGLPIPMDTPMMEILNPTFLMGKNLQTLITEILKIDVDKLLENYNEEIAENEDLFFPLYFEDMELDQQKVMLKQDLQGLKDFYSSLDIEKELIVKYLGC